jgi:hypothetical protein
MDTPEPPDPYEQAAAQQAADLGAAQASSIINNPFQVTPYGSQSYKLLGYETIYDAEGKAMKVPRYQMTQTLSPDQMRLQGLQTQMMGNLGKIGVQQSAKIGGILNKPLDTSGIQDWQSYGKAPQQQGTFGLGGPIQKGIGGAGQGIKQGWGSAGNIQQGFGGFGNVQTGYGSAGNVQRGIAGGGPIQRGIGAAGQQQTGFGGTGPMTSQIGAVGQGVQGRFAGGGQLRQDQTPTDRRAIERAMMQSTERGLRSGERAEDAQLAARGMGPGSEQDYRRRQARGDVRAEAGRQAYLASGAESRAAQEAFNQIQQTRFSQNATQAQFANAAQQQMFDQAAQRAGFQNAAQQQAYQQAMGRGQFANEAQQRMFDQQAQRAGFANAAQMQQFQQNAAQGQFANAAQQQVNDQMAQRAGFANAAQMQQYQQSLGQAGFRNQAQQQQYEQMAQRAGFANAAQMQAFQQRQAAGTFANQAQQQQFGQNMAGAQFANQAMQQNWANQMNWVNAMNTLRGGQLQERIALRNQPMNEIAALMSGSQVTLPQFQQYSQQGINAAPIGQYIGQNYANQANAAAQQNQGMFGLGGSFMNMLGALPWSDRRLKEDIEPTGGELAGLPLYTFRFIGHPEVHTGVMSDEVRELHPDAVVVHASGYDMVDYGLLNRRHADDRLV